MFRRLEYNFFSKQRRIFNRIFLKIHNDLFVILPNIFYPNVKEKIRIVKYMKLLMEFKKLISYIYIYVKLVKSQLVKQAEAHLLTQGRKWMRFRAKSTAFVA